MQCEAREQLEHDMASAYHHGIRQGREEGIQQGREEERRAGIRAFIEICKELGISEQKIKEKLQDKFSLSDQEAQSYIKKY
ncbi:MAG: hypothetical protein UHU19_01570 [Lachnospiraceae bacterium]|nr:hypothetical protein [Lachnospiraceae bacterium]